MTQQSSPISPISDKIEDAAATSNVGRDDLGDGHKEGQEGEIEARVHDPVHDIPGPPEAHLEMRAPRVARRPILPTKAEIAEHFPLHLHYRSWCEHCVAGKARMAPHLSQPSDRERLGVTVHMDYAFTTAEEAEETMQPTLIVYDDDQQSFWALGVKQKGVTEEIVKMSPGSWINLGTKGRSGR